MNKQEIMTKLLNDKELSSEDIIFIGRNIIDTASTIPSYDHDKSNPWEACGISEKDAEDMNVQLNEEISRLKGSKVSELVEGLEKRLIGNDIALRILIMQTLKSAMERQNPLLGLLGKLGGSGK